ncbi:hypothetical protein [Comamonas koreensis]|uniref:hypothetical protein n=1 Tax=Comamonas koreensis TaxID=160825 RepID=UPI0015F87EA6|nr:hypothetical protein [Comamonas koreensis]
MTVGLLAALVTVFVLGLWFTVTRPMAIAAAAALTFIYPLLLVFVLAGVALAVWHRYLR